MLVQAPDPYGYLATTDKKLGFPKNALHERVLRRLEDAGYVTVRNVRKTRLKDAHIEVDVH